MYDEQVFLSDASVPGEGEHKIVDFIRRQREDPKYNPKMVSQSCVSNVSVICVFCRSTSFKAATLILSCSAWPRTSVTCTSCATSPASAGKGDQGWLGAASHHITSHHITSHHITPHHITSHHITSHHITSHHITSHHITSHHITSHHITSHHARLVCALCNSKGHTTMQCKGKSSVAKIDIAAMRFVKISLDVVRQVLFVEPSLHRIAP